LEFNKFGNALETLEINFQSLMFWKHFPEIPNFFLKYMLCLRVSKTWKLFWKISNIGIFTNISKKFPVSFQISFLFNYCFQKISKIWKFIPSFSTKIDSNSFPTVSTFSKNFIILAFPNFGFPSFGIPKFFQS
jgi:hypothetical protein